MLLNSVVVDTMVGRNSVVLYSGDVVNSVMVDTVGVLDSVVLDSDVMIASIAVENSVVLDSDVVVASDVLRISQAVWRLPVMYITVKSKCHDSTPCRSGRTCAKTGHSCCRKVVAFNHWPAKSVWRDVSRRSRLLSNASVGDAKFGAYVTSDRL